MISNIEFSLMWYVPIFPSGFFDFPLKLFCQKYLYKNMGKIYGVRNIGIIGNHHMYYNTSHFFKCNDYKALSYFCCH